MMIFFWILIGVGVYLLWNQRNDLKKPDSRNDAETRLQERFVNGEIDEETYLRMKRILER